MKKVIVEALTAATVGIGSHYISKGKSHTFEIEDDIFDSLETLKTAGLISLSEVVDGEFSGDVVITGKLNVAGNVEAAADVLVAGDVEADTLDVDGATTIPTAAAIKTVTIGNLVGGAILAETAAADRTYVVTTANIKAGKAGTLTWYTTDAKAAVGTAPAGILISAVGVSAANAITLAVRVTEAAPTVAGSYYFTVTVDKVESAVKTLTIGAKE